MFNFIDLFAGIGGMRLGVEQALKKLNLRGRCVFTSEYDKYAVQTYKHFFGSDQEVFGDITKLETEAQIRAEIPEHQILLAGFPCQPFSIAGVSKKKSLGRAHGFDDPTQGTLFFNLKEIIRIKCPDAFLLENVKNLVSHDGGETYRIIMDALQSELGYQVHTMILDGQAFVPQHRERIYFVGFRKPRRWSEVVLRGRSPKLERVLETNVDSKYTLSPQLWKYLQAYAAKHRAKGNGFGCSVVGPKDVARTLSARYYKDGSEILIRQSGGTPRRLTPRECARLMGFPPRFKPPETISDTRAYKQFGNSVVVPVIRVIACRMLEALQGQVDRSAPSVQIPVRAPQTTLPLSA